MFSYEDENSLGHNSVRSILKDNQGGIWIGTFYGGLNYYHSMAPSFDTMSHSDYHNSISDNTVSCIVEDPHTGNLWIGTNDGGLNEYDRKKNHFTAFPANLNNPHALQSNNIKCVLPDTEGVYVGSHGGGLAYLSRNSRQVENFSFPKAVAVSNSCYSLLDGYDGTLWVGSIIGLYQFNKNTRQLSLHPLAQKYPELNTVLISLLYRDSKNRIWIGTEESLFVYANGKLEEWKDHTSKTQALIQAFYIQEDSNHSIWIGSSVGLYQSADGKAESLIRYTTKDGLPSNFIHGILEDGRGRLWITTNSGLSCFNPAEKTFLNYTKQDGLSHEQFNTYGACKTKDGMFYLGSLKGITYFNPYEFVDNPFSPNAVITGATIMNQPVTNINDGTAGFFQAENGRLLGMTFPSNMKLFSVRFSVINYLSGRRNLFAYKLEGFDDVWFQDNVDYAVLGYLAGEIAINRVPVIKGLPQRTTQDNLKSFSAAAASGGAVSLFHVVGITPEAPTLEAAFQGTTDYETIKITPDRMRELRRRLNTGDKEQVDMVLTGCPHLSVDEIGQIAKEIEGKKVCEGTDFWIQTSHPIYELAKIAGYVDVLEAAGAVLVRDSCLMEMEYNGMWTGKHFVTNSGKAAQYAPAINSVKITMADLKGCVKAAVTGKVPEEV